MTNEKNIKKEKDEEPKSYVLTLTEIASRDRKGKELKDLKGNLIYRQSDAFAFNQILGAIDTANYDIDSLRILGKLQDRFEDAWKNEKTKVELNLDMVSFLKEFYKDYRKKLRRDAIINTFLSRTLVDIADQIAKF